MKIEILNTGSELLLGRVTNSHAAFFGRELFQLGLRVQRQVCVPDGEDISGALEEAFPRCDLILVTGGLGPTHDDLTRETAARLLRRELRLDGGILEGIKSLFRDRGLCWSSSNERQAFVPEGAEVLANPRGTAPGLYLPAVDSPRSPHLFLLPGPPRELHPMFHEEVLPRIESFRGEEAGVACSRNFRICGVGESALASRLEPFFGEMPDLEVGYCAKPGEVDLILIGPEELVERAAGEVRRAYPRDIANESEAPLAETVRELLAARGETVCTVESCTGGSIASALTDVSGSSEVFRCGFVTYSNQAKTELVAVPAETIEAHGAVSGETAVAMAEGGLARSGADHAVAVSGIAGPAGGTEEKPVGTVQVAVASRGGGTFSKRYHFPLERIAFKERVTRLALDLLRRRLRGFPLDS